MNFSRHFFLAAFALVCLTLFGCKVKYSFTGAQIPVDAKTFSVSYFPNNATLVAPILSATLTDGLQERFLRQTRLQQVREGGDLHLEGEIIGYTSTPSSITSSPDGTQGAVMNRLTVTVKVRYTNVLEPQWNYDRSFSAYQDYDSNALLQSVEGTLITQIVDMLVEDIFNAAVANW